VANLGEKAVLEKRRRVRYKQAYFFPRAWGDKVRGRRDAGQKDSHKPHRALRGTLFGVEKGDKY